MKTWRKYRTYKRVQKLWLEYKEVAQRELAKPEPKLEIISKKMSEFLDSFQSAYVEFKSSGHGMTLDAFYGDCSEVLVSLLDLVDGHARSSGQDDGDSPVGADVATKVVGMVKEASQSGLPGKVAEWASQGGEMPARGPAGEEAGPGGGGGRLSASLAEKLEGADPAVSAAIAETIHKALSVAELIVREEKYRGIATHYAPQVVHKVLALLDNVKTPESKKIALRMIATMSHTMESRLEICRLHGFKKVLQVLVEGEEGLSKEALQTLKHFLEVQEHEAAAEQSDAPPQLKEAIENAASTTRRMGFNLPVSPSTVWHMTRGVVSEAQRLLGASGAKGEGEAGDDGDAASDCAQESDGEGEEGAGARGGPKLFPPSRRAVAERIEEVELEVREIEAEAETRRGMLGLEGELTPEAMAELLVNQTQGLRLGPEASRRSEEVIKELMGVQGALQTLAGKLAEAACDVQLDMMATISKLLRNSRRNKREFKLMDGYALLRKVFAGIRDYASPASQLFVRDVFNIMHTIILDGSPDRLVGNLDALELVLRMIPSDLPVEVRLRAVLCVQELLVVNPMNVVCVRRADGFAALLQGLSAIPRSAEVLLGGRRFGLSAGAMRLAEEVCETVCYAAVILSRHDSELVEDALAAVLHSPMLPPVRLQLLRCLRDMLRDRNSRRLPPVSPAVLSAMVEALNKAGKQQGSGRRGREGWEGGGGRGGEEGDEGGELTWEWTVVWGLGKAASKDNAAVLLLEALGQAVCSDAGQVAALQQAGGLEMLTQWVASELSCAVSALACWLLLHLLWLSPPHVDVAPAVTRLLELERLSAAKRLLALSMLRAWLHELQGDVRMRALRLKLRDAGLVNVLLELVKSAGPTVAREAFLAVGGLAGPCEGVKQSLERTVGCVALSQLLNDSALRADTPVMEALLHVAAEGEALCPILAPALLPPPSVPADLDCAVVLHLRQPGPRFIAPLQSSREQAEAGAGAGRDREETATASSRRSDASSSHNANGSRHSHTLNGTSSVSSRRGGAARKMSSSAASRSGSEQEREALEELPDVGDGEGWLRAWGADEKAAGWEGGSWWGAGGDKGGGRERGEAGGEGEGGEEAWVGEYLLRSTDAAMMLLNVLPRAEEQAQRAVVELLEAVLESNPANCLLLSKMQGMNVVLGVLAQYHPDVQPRLLRLLGTVGSYNTSPAEVRMLLDLAALEPPPPRSEEADSPAPANASGNTSTNSGSQGGADGVSSELREQVVETICTISNREAPLSFFHLDGRPGWVRVAPLEKFPPPKTGYTLSCWLRVKQFLGEECTFLRWLQSNGDQVLELYFQRIGADDHSARCLSVRTQAEELQCQDPLKPFAFNAFNAHPLAADDTWHHLVFSQCNRTLSLHLDGKFVQSCSFTAYPGPPGGAAVSKERPLIPVFLGDKDDKGGLRGQVSAISLYEGEWNPKTVAASYALGTLHVDKPKVKGSLGEQRPLAVVHPRTSSHLRAPFAAAGLKAAGASMSTMGELEGTLTRSLTSGTATLSDLVEDVFDRFNHALALPPQRNSADPAASSAKSAKQSREVQGELGGSIQAHNTRSLQEALAEVGGFPLVLRLLLARHGGVQVGALRILDGVLRRWDTNRAAFAQGVTEEGAQVKGYAVLLFLLSQQGDLSIGIFQELLAMAMGPGPGEPRDGRVVLREPECARVVMDLLTLSRAPVQRAVLRSVEDSVFTSGASRERWMSAEGLGVPILLCLLRASAPALHPVILAVLQQTSPAWQAAEVEALLSFLVGDSKTSSEVQAAVVDLLNQLVTTRKIAVEQVGSQTGLELVLCLLERPADRVQCGGLRLLGMMLDCPKSLKLFNKAGGFDVVRHVLTQQPPSMQSCATLMQLALGAFKPEDAEGHALGGELEEGMLAYPQGVQVLMAMAVAAHDEELSVSALSQVLLLASKKVNALQLLAHGALEWCRALLFPALPGSARRGLGRAKGVVRSIVGKLSVHALFGDPRLLKVKELVDDEELHGVVMGQVLAHLEADASIPHAAAGSVLRGLAALLEPLVEAASQGDPPFYLQVVRVINRIANQNTDTVRSTMKEVALLELRDSLLIRCLRGPITRQGAMALMQGFSFEWVAEKAAFRDAGGLCHLLHILHAFPEERDLQIGVGCVLRNVFGPWEENRKAILKVMEDAEVGTVFAPWAVESALPFVVEGAGEAEGDDLDPAEEGALVVMSFLNWYYEPAQAARREAIEARINRQIASMEATVRRGQEKAAGKRSKRLKQLQERQGKAAAAVEHAVAQAEEKRRLRVQQCVADVARQDKTWRHALQERLAEGARVWASMEEGKVKAPPLSEERKGGRASHSYDGDSPAGSGGGFGGSFRTSSSFLLSPREMLSPR